jgi:hypothetical protein
MKLTMLRDKLTRARYQFSIATDMGSFLSMVNQDDPFLKWRVDWYLAWRDGRYNPKAKLRIYLRNPVKNDFISVYKQLNQDDALVKVAECSNFASHAMAILLNDQQVIDEYNVCLASIGELLNHTIVILLPKRASHLIDGWDTPDSMPKGMLIVDPWAMVMGYGIDVSLAVKPRHYAYEELLEKGILLYQSIHDLTVEEPTLLTPSPYDSSILQQGVSLIGKISAERKLELEYRLFGPPGSIKSSSELLDESKGQSIKNGGRR